MPREWRGLLRGCRSRPPACARRSDPRAHLPAPPPPVPKPRTPFAKRYPSPPVHPDSNRGARQQSAPTSARRGRVLPRCRLAQPGTHLAGRGVAIGFATKAHVGAPHPADGCSRSPARPLLPGKQRRQWPRPPHASREHAHGGGRPGPIRLRSQERHFRSGAGGSPHRNWTSPSPSLHRCSEFTPAGKQAE